MGVGFPRYQVEQINDTTHSSSSAEGFIYLVNENQGGKGSSTSYMLKFQCPSNPFHLSLSLRAFQAARLSHRSCGSFACPSLPSSSSSSSSNFPCTCLFASPLKPQHPWLTIRRLASLKGGIPYMAWGWSQQVARPTTPLTPPWRLPKYILYIYIYICV